MKESKFVEQNKKIWLDFETDLRSGNNKTRQSRLFIQVTDDLSYARTFYKFRSVKLYLNSIAQLIFNNLYQNQTAKFQNFKNFWLYDLPAQIHDARKEFRISFIIFVVAMGIGVLSSIYDHDFARLILGNDYVQMTIENIKHNDPLAVYKKANEAEMFLGISFNNLVVSAYTFLLGAFMSIGTFLALLRNGIMLGVFQYFFIERGLFQESFLTIWQHGTIEISCIIIAGAAGLTMGKGIVFPGTYTRVNSFKISALRGLKIFTGIAPLIILAAFIESFLTRHTGINNGVRLAVIILSLFFILFYFVWYPWCLSKTRSQNHVQSEKISYKEPTGYDFSRVLSAEQILGNTFKFFNQNILSFIMVVFGLATIHSIISYGFSSLQDNSGLLNVHSIRSFFQLSSIRAHFWFGVITLSILQMHLCLKISKLLNDKHAANSSFLYLVLASFTASFIVLLPFSIGLFWGIVSFIIIGPVLFLAVYKSYHERIFVIAALPGTFLLISNSWGNQFWNSLKIFIFVTVLFVLLNTQVVWEYIQGVFINFKSDDSLTNTLEIIVLTFLTISLMAVYLYFLVTTSIFNYYSFKEIALAESLNDRIDAFGQRNSLFGFEKETKR